jgi:phosphate:Na+ symporter
MEIDILKVVLTLAAGLVVFLYALNLLSDSMKAVAGERLKNFLGRFTRNLFTAIVSGTIVTILLDSSSAVIIMTIAFVGAGVLTFRQSMGIVMGANIGTTISSQIIAFDIGEWSAVPMLVGFVILFVSKKARPQAMGKIVFSTGLLFFGLYVMGEAVSPLKNSDAFERWMTQMETPWRGVFAGLVTTLVIQSSSATVGMVVKLSHEGLISLAAGIAIMMGAELGTCSDTLFATLGQSRSAIKTGIFHLFFNITSIFIGVLFIGAFTKLVLWLTPSDAIAHQIAQAHMLFNIIGVLLFLPLVGTINRLLDAWLPDKVPVPQT